MIKFVQVTTETTRRGAYSGAYVLYNSGRVKIYDMENLPNTVATFIANANIRQLEDDRLFRIFNPGACRKTIRYYNDPEIVKNLKI